MLDAGKAAGGAVVDAGKATADAAAAAGQATVDAGEAAGGAVLDAGKAAGGAVVDASKSATASSSEAIKEAEKRLKEAMNPGLFSKFDASKLQEAIENAKQVGVDAAKVAAAETTQAVNKMGSTVVGGAKGAADGVTTTYGVKAVTALSYSGATAEQKKEAEDDLRAVFNKFDRNHSGKMDHKELKKALATVGMEMDADQAKELLAKYDMDGSGLMEFEEFKMLCIALNAVNLNSPVKTLDEQREAEVGRQRSNLGTGRQESGSQEASIDRCC